MKDKTDFQHQVFFQHQIYERIVGLVYFELDTKNDVMQIEFNERIQQRLQITYQNITVTTDEFFTFLTDGNQDFFRNMLDRVKALPYDEEFRTPPHRLSFPQAIRPVWVISIFNRISDDVIYGIQVDVTDNLEKQVELRKTRDEFEILINNTSNLFVRFDRNGKILDANKAFMRTYNLNKDTVKDANFFALNHESVITDYAGRRVNLRQTTSGDATIQVQGDSVRYVRMSFHPLKRDDRLEVIGIGHDITSIVELNQKLEYDYLHDEATDFLNQEGLKRALNELEGRNLVAYFIHFTNFADLNDFYGHAFGEQILKKVSERTKRMVSNRAIVARMTSDKMIIVEPFDMQDVGHLFHTTFYRELSRPIEINHQRVYLNVRIGYTFYPTDAPTMKDLVTFSRLACSHAVEHEMRYARFEPSIYDRFQKQVALSIDLKKAIENDEIDIVFQPVINARTNQCESFEAFARWKHPKEGDIPPLVFFNLAEKAGFVEELDYFIIDKSLRYFKEIKKSEGYQQARLSINITHKTLLEPLLNQYLHRKIKQLDLSFSDIYLEISENSFVSDQVEVIRQIEQLRKLGLHIILDNFGSQYSSLSFLDSVNIDTIKVDQSFVHKLPKVSTEKILQTILTIGIIQNKRIIVEGVETNDQIRRLTKLGYYLFQGFYYSKPLKARELLKKTTFV